MFKKARFTVRAVEGVENGGSAPSNDDSNQHEEKINTNNTDDESNQSRKEDDEDWKSKYEEMKSKYEDMRGHSRTWEQRAKDNLAELEKIRNSDDPNRDALEGRIAQLEKDYAKSQQDNLRLSIGAEYGLDKQDIEFLSGPEDVMRQLAQRLADRRVHQSAPENQFQGCGEQGNSRASDEAWAAKLLGKKTDN